MNTRPSVAVRALLALLLLAGPLAFAQQTRFSGQLSGWFTGQPEAPAAAELGLRYIPELSLSAPISEKLEFSTEAALDIHGFGARRSGQGTSGDSDIDPYRLWARLSWPQLEMRAGLQKINFGSATLLRPLRWFDSIDPRDPLRLTDGVYALLGRYYFQNNSNIWAWALYGNDELKGWETEPSDYGNLELGGRIQFPVLSGELGLSYHQRKVDPKDSYLGLFYPAQARFSEQRIGIDGKWDVGVGLWFEATLTRQDLDVSAPGYRQLLTLGTDYTFDIGNGPHLLFEQMLRVQSKDPFGSGDLQTISALAADYPLTLLDSIAATVYYDWRNDTWTPFVAWRRTYDNWQVHVSAFWSPDRPPMDRDADGNRGFAGKGVQLMLVFNH